MDLWDKLDRKLRALETLYAGRPSPVRAVKLVRSWFQLRRLIWKDGGRELLSGNAHLADRFLKLQRAHKLSVIVKPFLAYASF